MWGALASAASHGAYAASFEHIVFDPQNGRFDNFLLTNYLNTAFDTAQVTKTFTQDGYWHNHEDIFDALTNPHEHIKNDGGYGEFFRQEFASTHVLPNITLHLLGNGYDYRALAEWFDYHRVPYPFVWAFFASYAGYIGNEAIEASNPEMDSLDHLADLYIFNFFGNLLFTSDTVANFVHHKLQMRNWTGQPFLDVRNGEILNATNNYVLRPRLLGEHVRPFLYFGLHYFGGVSVKMADDSEVSVGAGLAATDPLREIDDFSDNLKTIRPAGGVFWDRNDRLLASVVLHGTQDLLVRANLYPEIFRGDDFDLGFFLGIAGDGMPSFGMTVRRFIGLGFS